MFYGSYTKYIQNCLNYGTIVHSGDTVNTLGIGGIVGCSYYSFVDNCLSGGRTELNNKTGYIGSIVGTPYYSTNVTYCYYTKDANANSPCDHTNYIVDVTGTPNISSKLDTSLIGNLNNRVSVKGSNCGTNGLHCT